MRTLAIEKKWAVCPECGAKCVIYDDTADCHGVFCKCTRGCGTVFELVVESGEQIKECSKRS